MGDDESQPQVLGAGPPQQPAPAPALAANFPAAPTYNPYVTTQNPGMTMGIQSQNRNGSVKRCLKFGAARAQRRYKRGIKIFGRDNRPFDQARDCQVCKAKIKRNNLRPLGLDHTVSIPYFIGEHGGNLSPGRHRRHQQRQDCHISF